jgi:hypothetical protein
VCSELRVVVTFYRGREGVVVVSGYLITIMGYCRCRGRAAIESSIGEGRGVHAQPARRGATGLSVRGATTWQRRLRLRALSMTRPNGL